MRAGAQLLGIAIALAAVSAVARAQEVQQETKPATPPPTETPAMTPEEAELSAATFLAWPDRQFADDADAPPQSQCLDLFTPEEKPESPLPVIVWIHGGGWQDGDKRGALEWKPACFTHAGFLFASVNYRLAPAFPWPMFMLDVARGVAWLHEHVQEYGGDPERMVLIGHSAGAHIAALLATDQHWLADSLLASAPLNPATNAAAPNSTAMNSPPTSLLKGVILLDGAGYDLPRRAQHDSDALNSIGMVFGRDGSQWPAASPVTHIAAAKDLPPFLLVHAGNNKASELEGRELTRLLRRAGVPVDLVDAPDENHGTIQKVLGAPNDPTTAKALEFIRKVTGATAQAAKSPATPKPRAKRHGPY